MRFSPTFLLLPLVAACSLAPEPEPAAEPETESSAAGDSEDDFGEAPPDDSGFVPKHDVPPDTNRCDPMHPDCEAGEKCTLVREPNDTDFIGRCVAIAEQTVAIGERCVPLDEPGHDNCEAGSVCWDIMNGEGTCLGFCQGSEDNPKCEEGSVCNWGKSSDAGLCTPICDPLSTEECPETCGCYWANIDFFCLPRTSNIPTGEPCGFINDCAPVNLCVTAEALPECADQSCCAAFCDLGVGTCDAAGTSCVPFFRDGEAPPNYVHVGICIDPDFDY